MLPITKLMTLQIPTPLTDEVFAAVRTWQPEPPWPQVESIRKNRDAWEIEIRAICDAPTLASNLITREIPPDETNDTALVTILDRVQMAAGHFSITKQLIAALVAGYLRQIAGPRRDEVLRAITNDASEAAMRGDWLGVSIREFDFTPAFLHAWFLATLPQDGSGSGFWSVVGELAEVKPASALDVALLCNPIRSPIERRIRVRLLSGLRFQKKLLAETSAKLTSVLEELSVHIDPERRIDYFQTFDQPLWRGDVPTAELHELFERLDNATAAEQAIGFSFAIAIVGGRSPKEQHIAVLHWLRRYAAPTCSPEQKYRVAEVIWRIWKSITPDELGFDPTDLLFAIQPVPSDLAGVWREIEHTFQEMMHADAERFRRTLRSFARQHWNSLQSALAEEKAMSWMLSELGQLPWTETFVIELFSSAHSGERRLGDHLFEALKLAPVTAGAVPKFDGRGFELWLAEFQIRNVYQTVAAQLLTAARRIDESDAGMVQLFQSEAYFQCINLPGLCLEKIRSEAAAIPLLQRVVEAADEYFKNLRELQKSAIKAQQIPGFRRYQFRKAQADSRRMQEMVDKGSIFSFLTSKSYLLYGNQHAYLMEGNLTAPAGLQEISSSFEMPRMPGINPEALHIRTFHALAVLREIRGTGTQEPEQP